MSVELNSSIDLNSSVVNEFVANGSVGDVLKQDTTEWDELNTALGLREVIDSEVLLPGTGHSVKGVATARAQVNYFAKKKSYDYSEHMVDSSAVDIPATCNLQINHETLLFVHESISEEVAEFVRTKYLAFNDPKNASRYFESVRVEIEDTFNIETKEDFVSVRARWVLSKKSECEYDGSLLFRLIFPKLERLIQDEDGDRYEVQDTSEEHYEDDANIYRSEIAKVTIVSGLPSDNFPSGNVVDENQGQTIDFHIKEVIATTGSCSSRLADSTNKSSKRIATLIKVPQFKVIIAYKWVTIACVKTKIYYPKAQYRQADHSLHTHWTLEPDVAANLLKIIEKCAIRAAITGAVVGIVLQNFAAAIATFKEKFKTCFLSSISQEIECFFASIFVKIEVSQWKDL